MIKAIRIDYDVPAKMRDGTVLNANVFRPEEPGTYPVLLTRTPYGKDYMTGFPYMDVVRLAKSGYIVVIQDVRGRGSSGGKWELFINEALDGYDSVEWAAQLDASTGDVGMWGFSYLAYAQWAAALMKPPHLKAIAPTFSPTNFSNGLYWRGGAFELGVFIHLFLNSLGMETIFKQNRSDPSGLGDAVNGFVEEVDHIPESVFSSIALEDIASIKNTGLGSDVLKELLDNYGNEKFAAFPYSLGSRLTEIQLPTYNIAGWNDLFLQDTINNFLVHQDDAAKDSPGSKLIIGPWSHLNFSGTIGELDFGMKSSMSFIDGAFDHVGLIQRWFDFWLKDEKNGINEEPPVKIFLSGENTWMSAAHWPPEGMTITPYYLRENDALSLKPPVIEEKPDAYTYDPENPVITHGGSILMHPYFIPGPRDRCVLDNREDILRFSTPPLRNKLRLVGPVEAHIWASSSAPDTDFVATLVDVHPDGKAFNITDGIIRARFHSGSKPEFLVADGPYEFVIDLWSVGHVFLEGHHIRIDITSSNFPRWDRNPNTSDPVGRAVSAQPASQKVFHDVKHRSHILLPVLPS